ncbi:hypothetical protein QFZ58_006291 [Streptomyces sp. B1I3]|nr:hypothetical protein [Streptomyces sp. B1I3]
MHRPGPCTASAAEAVRYRGYRIEEVVTEP